MYRCLLCVLVVVCSASAQDMPLTQVLLPGEGWTAVPGDWKEVNGVASDSKGNLYVTQAGQKSIKRLTPSGDVSSFVNLPDFPTHLARGSADTLYANLPDTQSVLSISTKGKEPELQVAAKNVRVITMTAGRTGTLYLTTLRPPSVLLRTNDGELKTVASFTNVPLGITTWPDGGTLVVAQLHSSKLMTYRVEEDGTLTAGEGYYFLRARFSQPDAGDLTVDRTGRLYAATALGVQVFDVTGRMSGVLLKPLREPVTSLTFGGAEQELLYIVCGGRLFVRKMKSRGIR